jgi:AbrB family looped-hinge helix DNA binding protein
MRTKITLDKAGRIVLPKHLRDQMRLSPGDTLQIECDGESITLRPVRPKAMPKKECGIWVYQGASTDASIPELLAAQRSPDLTRQMTSHNMRLRR